MPTPFDTPDSSAARRESDALAARERRSEIAVPAASAPRSATVPISALTSGRRWRQAARWIGLLIFAVGALMLAFVFSEALSGFQNFTKPGFLSQKFNTLAGDDYASQIQAVIAVFGTELLRVLYLLLMGFLGSAIASKGIQFFAASEAVIDEAVAAGLDA
jgi:hypothetical protein